MPTLVDLITAFVFTVPRETFCTDCLASQIGVTRTDVKHGLAKLDGAIVTRPNGTCARCRAKGRVVLAGERPAVDETLGGDAWARLNLPSASLDTVDPRGPKGK
jgi:hypothetical protein